MTSPISTTLTVRRLTAAILGGLALLLISVFIFQPAAAQREPARLKPPFKLVTIDKRQPLLGLPPLPLNAPLIMSETFDSGFTYRVKYNYEASDAAQPWHLVNYSGIVDSSHTWGRVPGLVLTETVLPITDTIWNAGTNPPGGLGITPGTPYTVNQDSLLIYGPVNLSDYASIVVSATYFLDVQTEDAYGLAYSLDGTTFMAVSNEVGRDPTLSVQRTGYYNLPGATRQPTVWLAFYFTSGNHPIDALGVYIGDIVLRGVPLQKFYLPLVRYDRTPTPTSTPTSTPTPTPTATPVASYIYNYTFGNGTDTSNQDFVTWGKATSGQGCYYVSPGTSCAWGQELTTGGSPEGSLQVNQNGLYAWAAASPNNLAPTDFELSADIYVIEPKKNARIGLIFDASTGTFGRDGNGVPTFDANRNLYKFDLQFDEVTDTIIRYYRLEVCQTNITACSQPVAKTTIPSGYANNVGGWNNIKIQRLGTNIKVYLNNNLLINVTDGTHTGSLEYGVFLQSRDFNSTSNPLKIRVDNVRIKALP